MLAASLPFAADSKLKDYWRFGRVPCKLGVNGSIIDSVIFFTRKKYSTVRVNVLREPYRQLTESVKLINFFGSIFTLTAMAIDRYILICQSKEPVCSQGITRHITDLKNCSKSVQSFVIVQYWLSYA